MTIGEAAKKIRAAGSYIANAGEPPTVISRSPHRSGRCKTLKVDGENITINMTRDTGMKNI